MHPSPFVCRLCSITCERPLRSSLTPYPISTASYLDAGTEDIIQCFGGQHLKIIGIKDWMLFEWCTLSLSDNFCIKFNVVSTFCCFVVKSINAIKLWRLSGSLFWMLSVAIYEELPPCWQSQHHDDPVTSIWILLLCYHQIASSHMLLPFNMLSTCSSDVFCILDEQCGLFRLHACNIEASWAQHSWFNHPDPLSKITTKWKQYCE